MSSASPSVLPMYSENSVISFPTLTIAYYLFGSMGNFLGLIGGVKLNGHNYFMWSQSMKMTLEGHHKFEYLIEEVPRPRTRDP